MKVLLAFTALAAFNIAAAQKTIELKDFKSITVGSDIKLDIVKGTKNKIVISDDEDFEVENNNGNLSLKGDGNATLYYNNELESMTIGSDTEVNGSDEIKGKAFHLTAGSDSEIALNLNVQELQVTAGSDSEVSLTGKTKIMRATIGSDSRFSAQDLTAGNASINLGSDAEGSVNAKDTVEATVASDSSLKIYGNPKKVNEVKASDAQIVVVK